MVSCDLTQRPRSVSDNTYVYSAFGALERFSRIDVLNNNAASFQAGFLEEISPEQFRAQMEVNFFGALNVTRAVLPVMRQQRGGQLVTISSTAGIVAGEFTSAYAASKFALEVWMEALRPEVAPYGVTTTVVEPGFFRTDLLEPGPKPSPWRTFLDKNGQGVMHVCLFVGDRKVFQQQLASIGVGLPYHAGYYPDGSYSYVDSKEQLGLELSVNHQGNYNDLIGDLLGGLSQPLDELR